MRRTCAGVVVHLDGGVCVRKKDIERVYKEKTGKDFDIKLEGKTWSDEFQAYTYPVMKDKGDVFFDLHDLMIALSVNGDIKFNHWFFNSFMREVFLELEIAIRIHFAERIMDIAKEEE